MNNASILIPLACMAIALSACGGGGSGTPSAPMSYQVSASAGTGGTVTPTSVTVTSGSTTTLTVTPNSGYVIGSVTGCGGTLSGITYTTASISDACTVSASFLPQYAVTATAVNGGTISPSSATVTSGSTTNFTVTPKSDYVVSGVTGCAGTLSGSIYTTGTISSACTATATFVGKYTWINGPSSTALNGVYGTKGSASATNLPGARNSSVAWMDASHNLWLFGGHGYDYGSVPSADVMNDLWEYSTSSGEWTWVGGSNAVDAVGVYGSKGTPTSTTMPGARQNAVSWTDSSGKAWLFGGAGYAASSSSSGVLNDLWLYTPSNGEWTWVGGSNTGLAAGVYGTKGTAAITNVPGARYGAVSWKDANGNLWLFGGWGADDGGLLGNLNDVWEYSPTSGQWTWISGASTRDASGNYGHQGQAASTNVPGSRSFAVSWVDANGNVWLFGGLGADSVGTVGFLNDLWEFSPSTGDWIWVAGSETAAAIGVYGSQGVAAGTNVPGARRDATSWTDANGNLYLFGGWGADSAGTVSYLNDLWEYLPASGQWVWLTGSNTANALAVHGTIGVMAPTNMPGARQQVTSVKDANGTVWLFGGFGYAPTNSPNEINELWTIQTQ